MSDRTTYHRGARDFGTGYDMMARIVELEAALAKANDLADAVHMMTDRGVIWRDETEREFQAPIKTYEDALDTLTAYRQSRDATR